MFYKTYDREIGYERQIRRSKKFVESIFCGYNTLDEEEILQWILISLAYADDWLITQRYINYRDKYRAQMKQVRNAVFIV